jgi:hypothetical protein
MPDGIFYLNDEDRHGFPVNKTYTKIKHPLKNLERQRRVGYYNAGIHPGDAAYPRTCGVPTGTVHIFGFMISN